ncbi:hypothetical protein Sme01_35650 [Sphaerisporangium melleum]|uniref:DUF3147 family protein n=1 Tax=Sphaerisporangium melleum TaxID=321316 RepID=A0A917RAD5_9ACTN|nr:DUF3147 family protein [Sphaerisporangium melleum]GGK97219.1 hypothetical protein GCM10007964_44300 [Sphaerisporangium melleum]GII71089.1 hypothetical protein Sme01_35650 [Sphaerisporangium melleum]
MGEVATLAVRGLCGGLLVMAFALVGEIVSPKRFAGIFAAGPAVALAGMAVTLVTLGPADVAKAAYGMIIGAVALVAYCASAVSLVRRLGAVAGTVLAVLVWAAVAGLGWVLLG